MDTLNGANGGESDVASQSGGGPITFRFYDPDGIREEVVPSVEVEQTARGCKNGENDIYDEMGFVLTPVTCYEDVTGDDRTRVILVRPNNMLAEEEAIVRKRRASEINR